MLEGMIGIYISMILFSCIPGLVYISSSFLPNEDHRANANNPICAVDRAFTAQNGWRPSLEVQISMEP